MQAPSFLARTKLWFLGCLMVAGSVQAQLDADGPGAMSEAERQKWQAVLAQPVDPNALNTTRTVLYRQKDLAAFKLGDVVAREANLREWANIEEEGRWGLRGFLSGTEKREEAYVLGKELIQTVKWPPSAARIRLHVAMDYLDDSNLKETARLLAEVENIVRYELPRMPNRPDTQYWIARTELEYHTKLDALHQPISYRKCQAMGHVQHPHGGCRVGRSANQCGLICRRGMDLA